MHATPVMHRMTHASRDLAKAVTHFPAMGPYEMLACRSASRAGTWLGTPEPQGATQSQRSRGLDPHTLSCSQYLLVVCTKATEDDPRVVPTQMCPCVHGSVWVFTGVSTGHLIRGKDMETQMRTHSHGHEPGWLVQVLHI